MEDKTLEFVINLLKTALPEFSWLIQNINEHDGSLAFPEKVIDVILYDGSCSWSYLYDDLGHLAGLVGIDLLGPKKVKTLSDELSRLSDEERELKLLEIKEEILTLTQSGQLDNPPGSENLTPEQYFEFLYKNDDYRSQYVNSMLTMLPNFFQYLALMTHGYTMTQLVKMAKAGDDDAFCMAIQVDRTVLIGIPYFQQRITRIQLGDERQLLGKVSNALKGRIFGHKFRYPKLWLLFAILEDQKLLDMPLDNLLTVCEEVGVYGREYGVEDTNHLSKRRQEYKKRSGSLKPI